jgi:hypothetical protein
LSPHLMSANTAPAAGTSETGVALAHGTHPSYATHRRAARCRGDDAARGCRTSRPADRFNHRRRLGTGQADGRRVVAGTLGRGGRSSCSARPSCSDVTRRRTARTPMRRAVCSDSNGFAHGSLVPIAREGGGIDRHGMLFRDSFPDRAHPGAHPGNVAGRVARRFARCPWGSRSPDRCRPARQVCRPARSRWRRPQRWTVSPCRRRGVRSIPQAPAVDHRVGWRP